MQQWLVIGRNTLEIRFKSYWRSIQDLLYCMRECILSFKHGACCVDLHLIVNLFLFSRHGDGHSFYVRNDASNPNLYDLQVEDGKSADPLSITILRDDHGIDSFKIDRRAGTYKNGCNAGNNDVTWGYSLFWILDFVVIDLLVNGISILTTIAQCIVIPNIHINW